MGYRSSDRTYGEGRWRDRDEDRRPSARDDRGREYGRGDYGRDYTRGGDDRGFFERAGDEVRSWFGDDEAERRREMDERSWERERAMGGGGSDRGRSDRSGGGWGNQTGDSWRRDRPGEWSGPGGEGEWGTGRREEIFGDDRFQGGTSGFGGYPDHGRRFDRIDPGSVGTHGAHPMSSPVGGGAGGYSSARSAAILSGGLHDPHYSEWRGRQLDEFDRDYEDYRREHQSKFEQEFSAFRSKRQGQRQQLGRVSEHMEVEGSDGEHIGTVDKVRGDRIILTKSDQDAGGAHHSVPCAWIEKVEDKVILNRAAADAKKAWSEEESNRAFFDQGGGAGDRGGEGAHMLNRSFAGTYSDRDRDRDR
jgi:hypothetical protein